MLHKLFAENSCYQELTFLFMSKKPKNICLLAINLVETTGSEAKDSGPSVSLILYGIYTYGQRS